MPKQGGDAVVNKNPFKDTHSKVYVISNSDHHMYFDNPMEFAQKMLEDLEHLDNQDLILN